MRLDVEERHDQVNWISERDLGRDPRQRCIHRPDGLVRMDGREAAIEVELTLKERKRAKRIISELVATYDAVTYFVRPAAFRLISELAAELGAGRVQVLPLPGGER